MPQKPENTNKRNPLATLAVYSPLAAGIGVAGYRIKTEGKLKSGSSTKRVEDVVDEMSKKTVSSGEKAILARASEKNEAFKRASDILESLSSQESRKLFQDSPISLSRLIQRLSRTLVGVSAER